MLQPRADRGVGLDRAASLQVREADHPQNRWLCVRT